jgi:hypothetical protein
MSASATLAAAKYRKADSKRRSLLPDGQNFKATIAKNIPVPNSTKK